VSTGTVPVVSKKHRINITASQKFSLLSIKSQYPDLVPEDFLLSQNVVVRYVDLFDTANSVWFGGFKRDPYQYFATI
jgi:hypothetical protein